MKRTQAHFQLAILLMGLLALSSSAFAEQQDGGLVEEGEGAISDVAPTGGQPEEPTATTERRGSSTSESGPSDFVVRRQVAQLVKLQSAMKKKLGLTSTQKEAVDQLFKTYTRSLNGKDGRRRPFGVNPTDGNKLKNLRVQLAEAKKSGDEEAVRQLRKKFRQMLQTRTKAMALTLDQFFAKVVAELDEKQRQGFRSLIKRMRIGDVRHSRRGGLRRLLRTVMNPDVGLSSEQQQTLRTVFRSGSVAIAQAERDGADNVDELTAKLRVDVLNELTPAQRAAVEASLQENAARDRNRKAVGAGRGRAGDDSSCVGAESGEMPPDEEPEREDKPDNDDDR